MELTDASKARIFHELLSKLAAGQKPDPALLNQFVSLQNAHVQTGPKLGQKVPDFTLPDQDERKDTLHDLMGAKGLLLVFVRSADWWPYCRSQLVELQDSVKGLSRNEVHVATISYDPPETLKQFAGAHQITYPMLSDQGSAVIREFGILNTNIPPDTRFYGILFPGQYLLAPDGTLRDKLFLSDFETGLSASEMLLTHYGIPAAENGVTVNVEDVRATIILSDKRGFGGQRLGTRVDFKVAPGWHIYGKPLPEGYTPTSVEFDQSLVASQALRLPKPKPVKFELLGEALPVYEGEFKGEGYIVLNQKLAAGEQKLTGTINFQECNDNICKLPQSVHFEIPIKIEPYVPATAKK
jgi:peroxiredoxin